MDKKNSNNISLVTRSNKLIEARYKLSIYEQKVLYILISLIKPDDEILFPYRFKINEFASMIGMDVNSQNQYRKFKEVTHLLMTRVVQIYDEKKFIQAHWVSDAIYYDNQAEVEIILDEKLKPYLLDLKGFFTSIKLSELISFKSQYTSRIYELLLQYKNIRIRKIELEEFKAMLGFDSKEYKLFGHIKSRIINPSITEINFKTNLEVSWEPEKTGRKITALIFKIDSKTQTETPKNQSVMEGFSNQETVVTGENAIFEDLVIRFKFTSEEALDLIDQFSEYYCTAQIKYIDALKKKPSSRGINAYFKKAITNNYAKCQRAKGNCPKCQGSGVIVFTTKDASIDPIIVKCDCLY